MCDKLKNIKDQIETLSSTITDIETVLRAKDLPFLQVLLHNFINIIRASPAVTHMIWYDYFCTFCVFCGMVCCCILMFFFLLLFKYFAWQTLLLFLLWNQCWFLTPNILLMWCISPLSFFGLRTTSRQRKGMCISFLKVASPIAKNTMLWCQNMFQG